MKFKRIMAVAAIAVSSMLVVSGCSSTPAPSASDSKVDSIEYWYWQDDTTDTTMQDLATQFEKKTGIAVHIQNAIAQPKFYDALVNVIAAGNAPDATHLNTNMLGQLIDAKILAPLDDMVKGWDGQSDVVPTMWSYVKSPDGKQTFALPNKYLMFYMFYRVDLFKAAGIEVPKTQEEFVAAAKALTDPSKNHYGFDIRGGANGQDQWAAYLIAGGAEFLDSSGKVAFDSAAAKKANDSYISTFPYSPPGSINDGFAQIISNFESGTAAMIINHLGAAKTLQASTGDNVGAALIPSATGDPSKTTYMGTMNANAVLASSKKKEAAFKWISFLAEKDAQLAITKSTNGYLPVVKSVASDPQFDSNRFFQISVKASENKTAAWPSVTGTTVATQKTWGPLFQGALLNKNSNDDVVKGVAEALGKK